MTQTDDLSLDPFIQAIADRKAEDVTALDVRGLTSVADAFILCSGRSSRQVSSIADHVRTKLKKQGIRPLNVEGLKEGHWVLMDYGYVIIHLFHQPIREFYDLDSLWADAKRIDISAFIGNGQDAETGENAGKTTIIDEIID